MVKVLIRVGIQKIKVIVYHLRKLYSQSRISCVDKIEE